MPVCRPFARRESREWKKAKDVMLCEELEHLEGELDEIITALEDPDLSLYRRRELEEAYAQIVHRIEEHQKSGHRGGPCFEE